MEERKKIETTEEDEDEIVVAKMNVDGMPWYVPPAGQEDGAGEGDPPSRREMLRMMGGALKAALLVGAVFAAGMLLFLLFCVFVWFR
ncbi:MAG: hypothetical protein PUC59_06640 [Firmicutes bacterium]|nr:hypothetical protein [Bacillota bacterium]